MDGTPQTPIEGVSMVYSFADPKAAAGTRPNTSRSSDCSIYHEADGWLAGTVHRAGWEFKPRRPLEKDVWELYDNGRTSAWRTTWPPRTRASSRSCKISS